MKHRNMIHLILIFFAITVTACWSTSKPTIIITSPPSGSVFREGDEIIVQSTATDNAGIDRVELFVDDVTAQVAQSPSPQVAFTVVQTWRATAGVHILSVRAYTKAGAVSEPAAIAVNVAPGIAQAITPIASPIATFTATPLNPTATPTLSPSGDNCVNNSVFVSDVTIPDGMVIAPGQTFTKIWQLRNNGTCAWNNYQFVHVGGEAMSTGTTINVPFTAPGATANVAAPMTAPMTSGAHTGQWRMRAPNGAVFGNTVSVVIAVPGIAPATPSITPITCSGAPTITSFTASATGITASTTITVGTGTPVTLNWGAVTNAESAEIDQGIGGIETPGSRVVNPINTTTYTLAAKCGGAFALRQVLIKVVPPAPALIAPADGIVLRVYPRVATFTWGAVNYPGGVTYNIEIEMNTGAWQPRNNAAGLSTSYTMPAFTSDSQGRWRVWATNPTAGAGIKSEWRTFSFNTGASQYAGTWINDDLNTVGITRVIITPAAQSLAIRVYARCGNTECDYGTVNKPLDTSVEPIVVSGFSGAPGHTITITLNNNAGTALQIFHNTINATYMFHK